MQLKQKFFLIFSVLVIVPVLLLSYLVYAGYRDMVNERVQDTADNIMEQAVLKTNDTFENLEHILEVVQTDSPNNQTIFKELGKYTGSQDSYTDSDVYETNNILKYSFQNLIYSTENINGIFIFTPSGEILGQGYGNGVDVRSDYDPRGEDWYQQTLALEGQIYMEGVSLHSFLLNDTPSLLFSMTIYDVYTKEFLGVLYINCAPDFLALDSINTLPDTTLFYIRRGEEILYSNTGEEIGTEDSRHIVYTEELSIPEITLTAVFEKTDLSSGMQGTYELLGIATGILILMFVFIAFLLARYLTHPITELSTLMSRQLKKDRDSENSKSPYTERKDEIGILYNEYYNMLEENRNYIKNQYENRLILMDSQMKALEAQINAHFLYNTLEAINSIAEIEEVESISVMALALGDMFRYSIKTKGELVLLKDELTHVHNFVAIQLIRFEHAFQYEEQVPEELLERKVLKLILQPLVENALYHGLRHCSVGSRIVLCGQKQDKELILSVEDDGAGMEEETLRGLKASLAKKPEFQEFGKGKKNSIGLANIHSRIQLYYGEEYGIFIESEKGKGTKVTVRIPDAAEL